MQTTMLRMTYAATPEARAAYQNAGLELTCTPAPPPPVPDARSRRSRRRRRRSGPGCRARRATPGRRSPRRKPAFAATSAARQLAPDAVTCSHREVARLPVAGRRGARRARPCRSSRGRPRRRGSRRRREARRPPGRARRGRRRPRRSPARREPLPRRRRRATSRRRSGRARGRAAGRAAAGDRDLAPAAAERRVDEAFVSAATSSATSSVRAKSGETASTRAGDAVHARELRLGRKRLNASSQRSSTAATVAGSPPATTMSQPMARKRWTATALTTSSWRPAAAGRAARSGRPGRRCA